MGLDMYLHRKTYVRRWDHQDEEKKYSVTVKQGGKKVPLAHINPANISEITEHVGYWRKANAIHQWFVENVQSGEDDCREHYVSREDMQNLLDRVNEVLANSKLVKGKITNGYTYENGVQVPIMEDGEYIEDPTVAEELLPTRSGFFFGSTVYDQWYYRDLEETRDILTPLLETDYPGDIYYESSW